MLVRSNFLRERSKAKSYSTSHIQSIGKMKYWIIYSFSPDFQSLFFFLWQVQASAWPAHERMALHIESSQPFASRTGPGRSSAWSAGEAPFSGPLSTPATAPSFFAASPPRAAPRTSPGCFAPYSGSGQRAAAFHPAMSEPYSRRPAGSSAGAGSSCGNPGFPFPSGQ